ncbi:hypothetical protein [Streptomyces sp. NPDC002328]|uniref:hypothetical protein n=1 Tax=Streptomyces sp. NPDC002328 TaxID=3364642 RepID=UPI0036A68351
MTLSARRVRDCRNPRESRYIGSGLRADPLLAALTDCLMREGERPPASDPFPAWDTYGIDESCAHEHDLLTAVTEH